MKKEIEKQTGDRGKTAGKATGVFARIAAAQKASGEKKIIRHTADN